MMGRATLHTGSPVRMQIQRLRCPRMLHPRHGKSRRSGNCRHFRVHSSSADEVLRSVSENGEVSILVVKGTNLVQEVRCAWGRACVAQQA